MALTATEAILDTVRKYVATDQGKSWANKITGTFIDSIIMDEFTGWSDRPIFPIVKKPVFTVEDEKHPGATIHVVREELDPKDPRHPNPAAGRGSAYHFRLMHDNKPVGSTYVTIDIAKMQAKTFHKRLIDAILEKERAAFAEQRRINPNFGRFG